MAGITLWEMMDLIEREGIPSVYSLQDAVDEVHCDLKLVDRHSFASTDLQRLSEILGALHYLRDICGAREGQAWRNEMQALVDAEAPSGERRERLVASFNRGYRGFQQTYRTCTPAADLVIRRYLEEGSRIARDVTARYAN